MIWGSVSRRNIDNYGTDHQGCLAHIQHQLKDSMEDEPDVEQTDAYLEPWDDSFWHSLEACNVCDKEKSAKLEACYDQIVEKEKEEYENILATEYYKERYNLSVRMEKYRENHFLFFHNLQVPATKNEAERLLRGYRRKQKVNLFDGVSQIFG